MSKPVAVQTIANLAVYKCELPALGTDTNTSSTDMLMLIQERLDELSGMMNQYHSEGYNETTSTVTTVPGIPVVSLPGYFDKLTGLHWLHSDGSVEALRMANLEEVRPTASGDSWDTLAPVYRIRGNVLEFFPTPQTAESLEVRYSTGLTVTSLSDTLYLGYSWDQWLVYAVCCSIRMRQDKDYSNFAAEKAAIEQKIKSEARRRDRAGIATVRKVRDELPPRVPFYPRRGW